MHISSVKIRCGTYVDGIQAGLGRSPNIQSNSDFQDSKLIYTGQKGVATSESEGSYHGGDGGTEQIFSLKPEEHIVAVSGRQNKYIVQLCFETSLGAGRKFCNAEWADSLSLGRKSDVSGGDNGTAFMCRAPKADNGREMRLHYICGRRFVCIIMSSE